MRIRHRHSDDHYGNEKCSHDCFLSFCMANFMPEREFSLPIDTVIEKTALYVQKSAIVAIVQQWLA